MALISVLKLQYKRNEFLFNLWTIEDFNGNPTLFGWLKDDNDNYTIPLLDLSDELYTLPLKTLTSYTCTGECKECKCIIPELRKGLRKCKTSKSRKELMIDRKCARLTCKKCNCFKRQKYSEFENLAASSQYQQDLDDLSTDENSDLEADEPDI